MMGWGFRAIHPCKNEYLYFPYDGSWVDDVAQYICILVENEWTYLIRWAVG